MTHTFDIKGMTCNGCVNTVKTVLSNIKGIKKAEVTLEPPQAVVTMKEHIPLAVMNKALSESGSYSLTEKEPAHNSVFNSEPAEENSISDHSEAHRSFWDKYKPVLLVFAYLLGTTALSIIYTDNFDIMAAMHLFMGGFFLVFSFFKLLDLKGFAYSYMSYDIIAKKWLAWGYIYPFIELVLGLGFLFHLFIPVTVLVTLIVMSISSIGVLQSVFSGKKVKCVCLGTVFNLPMSNITLTEDMLMVVMSAAMLVM